MTIKLGEKIKKRRIELGLTQRSVAGDFMTRNMLSIIESGRSMPSVETAQYLARVLDLPLAYLFSDDDTLFFFEKKQNIARIRSLFADGEYALCIELIESLSGSDDELNYVHAFASLGLGKQLLFSGALSSAARHLTRARALASETCYDTSQIEATVPLYLSVANNIHTPLLELESDKYESIHSKICDFEFFKYVTMDFEYDFENEYYGKHLYAKQLLKKYSYHEAITALKELEETKNKSYNACVLFGVYSDLEIAYRQMGDFENAYRYASKKLSLISAFKE